MCVHWVFCLQINLIPSPSLFLPPSPFVLSMIWWCAVADVIEKLISTPIVFDAEVSGANLPQVSWRSIWMHATYSRLSQQRYRRNCPMCRKYTRQSWREEECSLFIESGTGGLIKYQVTKAQHKARGGTPPHMLVGREGACCLFCYFRKSEASTWLNNYQARSAAFTSCINAEHRPGAGSGIIPSGWSATVVRVETYGVDNWERGNLENCNRNHRSITSHCASRDTRVRVSVLFYKKHLNRTW